MEGNRRIRGFVVMIAWCCLVLSASMLVGCDKQSGSTNHTGQDKGTLAFTTEYQAVFLDNGQTFFGKLENAGSDYPVLTNVFYIRQEMNQETKEVKNVLIKRGNEWHGPDRMYINASHITLIEPVTQNSQVAIFIRETLMQKPGTAQ